MHDVKLEQQFASAHYHVLLTISVVSVVFAFRVHKQRFICTSIETQLIIDVHDEVGVAYGDYDFASDGIKYVESPIVLDHQPSPTFENILSRIKFGIMSVFEDTPLSRYRFPKVDSFDRLGDDMKGTVIDAHQPSDDDEYLV